MKILIAEDDEDSRVYLTRALKAKGYQVTAAANGIEALDAANKDTPDLIVSDIMMPEMDGFEFCRKLKADDSLKAVPFVFYTATYLESDNQEFGLSLGASRYLAKPMELPEFITAIKEVMDESNASDLPVQDESMIDEKKIDENYKNIIARKLDKKVAELARVNQALRTISRCNESLIHAENEKDFLEELCQVITLTGGYTGAWVGFIKQQQQGTVLQQMASEGIDSSLMGDCINILAAGGQGEMTALQTAALGETTVIQDVLSHPGCSRFCDELSEQNIRSVAAFPLREEDKLFGVLAIYSNEVNIYGVEEVKLLSELAGELGFGISMLRMRVDRELAIKEREIGALALQASMTQAIQAIAMTLEKRDPYTAGHQHRVSTIAVAIARELGWEKDRIQGLELGTLIHDIGKVSSPAEILNRPGKLTPDEFAIIKSHPQVGYEIIKDIEFPWPVADIVYQHHERLDGSGYPQGLKGDEIIPEAKITAVADVVEAITSHRPYRAARDLDIALNEIRDNRGTFYDPEVVDACLRLITEKNFALEGWPS